MTSALPDVQTLSDPDLVDAIMASEEGDLLRQGPMRRLIAQEFRVEEVRPFVETPDLLDGEEELIEGWRRERGPIAAAAEESMREALGDFDLSSAAKPAQRDRVVLRLAACRRLDSWLTGQDRLTARPHAFAGDLYRLLTLPGYPRPIKIGICSASFYGSDARQDQELRRLYLNEGVLQTVEFTLYPLAGRGGLTNAAHWCKIRERWRDCAPLRILEATTRRGAFPRGLFFQKPPSDVVPRVDPLFIQQVGQEVFARLGICAWWPRQTDEFMSEHQGSFPTTADDATLRWWAAKIYLTRRRARST